MNNLASNIEYLLLSHNSVIVPSLGAFYAIDTPAKWVSDEDVFLPPVRRIRFDGNIQADSTDCLIRSFAKTYNWTIEVARKRCQAMVEEFHRTLISKGTVDFGSIGIFTLEEDAEISFSSCECGIIAPEYYGLDTLHFKNITDADRANKPNKTIMEIIPEKIYSGTNTTPQVQGTNKNNQKPQTVEQKDDTHYTIRVSKSAVNYAMAVAATIALFFIMRPTTISNSVNLQQMARPVMFLQPEMVKQDNYLNILDEVDINEEVNQDSLSITNDALIDVTEELDEVSTQLKTAAETALTQPTETPLPATVEVKPAKEVNEVKKVQETKKTPEVKEVKKTPELKEVKKVHETEKSAFCIVLASGVSRVNAEAYAEKLNKENIKASVIEGDLRRVVIDGFSTYEGAHQHMATLKASGKCADAWVLKK